MAEPRDEVEQELAATLVWRQQYDAMIPTARRARAVLAEIGSQLNRIDGAVDLLRAALSIRRICARPVSRSRWPKTPLLE
jgi:hypothetical protein